MKPDPKTPVQILVKTSGKSHEQAAVHLCNPHPRYDYYGTQSYAGSVCYTQVSPSWDGWELRDGTLGDVTCAKCLSWAVGAHKRELRWLCKVAGWSWYPTQRAAGEPKRPTRRYRDRCAREFERWERWTGQPHPGQGVR